ncbi:MAG TPA: ribosome small subunit-dependent GTPase A [Vicinamibacteria bacterium]|nr:ribosome small subunit-dependent GTPase A [Vicinamibacteria bacterium]
MSLEDYGYGPFFSEALERLQPGLEPARVVVSSGGYRLGTTSGEVPARPSGRLLHDGTSIAVGDWVAWDRESGLIRHVLPRRTKLSRKAAGRKTEEQVVAANLDMVLLVMGLDGDFNPRRVERYLAAIRESGASPIVVLNKSDLPTGCSEHALRSVTLGVPVVTLSALTGVGLDGIHAHLQPRKTAVLVGSSGAGKSTLINRLVGRSVQKTASVRAHDERGRHTTSRRELFVVPSGAILIDNPGIRELQLWSTKPSLDATFEDIARLSRACRFRDCSHQHEPGCAVVSAITAGDLSEGRLESFRALEKELRYLQIRQDESAQHLEKQKWRAIHREMRRSGRHRRT